MTLKPAKTIPFCEECQTRFAFKCRHAEDKPAEAKGIVWKVDPLPDQEVP